MKTKQRQEQDAFFMICMNDITNMQHILNVWT